MPWIFCITPNYGPHMHPEYISGDGSYYQKERIAWINIIGVSIRLWCNETFDLIANILGRIVSPSTVSPEDVNLTANRVAIITTKLDRILESFNLKWKSENFRISIEEDLIYCFPYFMNIQTSTPSSPYLEPTL